jgi:hypothetical protein
MARNNNNNKRKVVRKNRRTTKKSLTKQTRLSSINPKAVERFCSVTDPFCVEAVGSKSPYGSKSPTVSFQMRFLGAQATQAGGVTYTLIRGSSSSLAGFASAPADTVFPASTDYNLSLGSFPSNIDEVRLISTGVRWWPIYPDTVAGGAITIVPVSDDTEIMDGETITKSVLMNSPGAFTVPIEAGSYVLPFKQSGTTEAFLTPNASASSGTNWTDGVMLILEGQVTSTYIMLEIVANYEATIDVATGFSLGSKHPRDKQLVEYVEENTFSGYVKGGLEQAARKAKNAALQYIKANAWELSKTVGTLGMNYFLPGSGTAARALTNGPIIVD